MSRLRGPKRLRGLLGAAVFVLSVGLSGPAGAGAATPAPEPEFRRHLEDLVLAGRLSADEFLLIRFQRVFAPVDLPTRFQAADAWPAKSATLLVHEFATRAEALDPATARQIEGYLLSPTDDDLLLHRTPHFRFEYSVTGPDAVPIGDVAPANGLPDFVDVVADAAEAAWQRLVGEAGFSTPETDAEGRVRVSFREMSAYGFTRMAEGAAEIVLHRDFADFPSNHDPAGSAIGAAKVTIAHELKHASQHAASGWTEGGWLEADATWAEDLVFDEVNDYLRYLPHGSPVSHPEDWFPVAYEDCLWSHALAQTHGEAVLVEFFERRAAHSGEAVLVSYDRVLEARGSSLANAAGTLGIWCHFTGAHAPGRPVGFRDAELYPTPPLHDSLLDPSASLARSLPALGSHQILVTPSGRTGPPRIEFIGSGAADWSVRAVSVDLAGERHVQIIPLAAAGVASQEVSLPWESTSRLYVVLTRVDRAFGETGYTLSVDDRNAVGVDGTAAAGRFRLAPNRPNPFRTSTTITYELPLGGVVRLSVYDIGGRLLRRLVDARRQPAGSHAVTWNGADDGGRPVAPGVYYVRLEAGDRSSARRMLLLR